MKIANKKIRNATVCKDSSITFKSVTEKRFYNILLQHGFNPQYEPKTFTLWDGFQPITPYYDKETDKQVAKRLEEGVNDCPSNVSTEDWENSRHQIYSGLLF